MGVGFHQGVEFLDNLEERFLLLAQKKFPSPILDGSPYTPGSTCPTQGQNTYFKSCFSWRVTNVSQSMFWGSLQKNVRGMG